MNYRMLFLGNIISCLECPAVGGSEELFQWKALGLGDQNLGWDKAQQLEENEWQFSGDDTHPLDSMEGPPLHLRASPCIVWDKAQSMLIKSPSFKGKMIQLNLPDPAMSLLPSSWLQHPILPASHNELWIYYPYDSGTSKENYSFCWLFDFVSKMTLCFYFGRFSLSSIHNTHRATALSLASECKSNQIKSTSAWFWKGWARCCHLKGFFVCLLELLIKFCANH